MNTPDYDRVAFWLLWALVALAVLGGVSAVVLVGLILKAIAGWVFS